MDSYQIFLVVVVLIGVLLFVTYMTCFEIVKRKGSLYKNLKQLNKRYKLKKELPEQKNLFYKCNNKSDYNKMECDNYLDYDINNNILQYESLMSINEQAYQQYREYVKEYNKLLPDVPENNFNFKFENLKKWIIHHYELLIFKTYKLRHYDYTKVSVKISYRSPQGRTNLNKSNTYSYDSWKKHYDIVLERKKNSSTRENIIRVERAKVTPSLRYKILKRDNYICQKCGVTRSDGVILCVDHIVPVSKGGKTVESNLQILCERCNLGKGAGDN